MNHTTRSLGYRTWIVLAVLALTLGGPATAAQKIDLSHYYPLQDGNAWTYQFRAHQPDGQVKYSIKTYTVAGDVELENGETVKKLIDQRGWYYLLTVDADQYLHWGEHENKGLVTNDPPFTFYDTGYAYGHTYRAAHAISDGSARGTEVVFDGLESLKVPAGEFKNCLKSTFTYINPNGSTFTSTTYLAEGVGVVKKVFQIYSPKAGQTLTFDRVLLHATVNGQQVGGKKAIKVADLGAYFPFYQADSWTYDWAYTMADGTVRSEDRTRTFAGAEFFDNTAAFKLLDNKGSFQYYTYNSAYGIRMHGSYESRPGGQVFTYEPAIDVVRADQVMGIPYTWSEAESTQPEDVGRYKRMQHWTSMVEGFETLVTPMGTFDDVLRTRLSWTTSKSWVKQTYYFAKDVGIVGIDYEAIDKSTGERIIGLEARLKNAKLQGDEIASVDDVPGHVANVVAAAALLKDDPEARAIFRAASENRYVWDDDFPGIKADLEIIDHGGEPFMASVTVDPRLKVDFECESCDGKMRSLLRAQISQFVTHRSWEKFDDKYGVGQAYFQFVEKRDDGMYEIKVDGETAMGSWYLIDGKEVRKLTRSLGGPVRFMINHEKNIVTEDGRYIANYYPVVFYMEMGDEKMDLGKVVYDDVFVKNGDYWLPKHRKLKGQLPQPDRSIIDVDLEVQFTNVAYLN